MTMTPSNPRPAPGDEHARLLNAKAGLLTWAQGHDDAKRRARPRAGSVVMWSAVALLGGVVAGRVASQSWRRRTIPAGPSKTTSRLGRLVTVARIGGWVIPLALRLVARSSGARPRAGPD